MRIKVVGVNKFMVNPNKHSFSLVEVLVFVTIVSIMFVMAAAATLTAFRNMKYNEHKIIATHFARQLEDWLRADKETDWNVFITHSGPYCFNSVSISWGAAGSCAGSHNGLAPAIYDRQVTLTITNPQQVNVSIVVSWVDLGRTYSITQNTQFNVLEQ